uniref:Uncharacterized protein n=1 Tax=Strongyloides papillosus TaxID=174720 RepID=A0A0N5BZ98_STREA
MNPTNKYNRSSRFIPPINQTIGLQKFENKLKRVFDKTLKVGNYNNPDVNQSNCKIEKPCQNNGYLTLNEMKISRKKEVSEIETYIREEPIPRKVRSKSINHRQIIFNHCNENECASKVYPTKQNKQYLNAFAKNQVIEVLESVSIALKNKNIDVFI